MKNEKQKVMGAFAPMKNKPIHTAEEWQGKAFETIPMDEEWKLTLQSKSWSTNYTGNEKVPADLLDLRDRLLAFGGEQACLPMFEEDLSDILAYGQLWDGRNRIKMMKGNMCRCHENCADLWDANRNNTDLNGELTIATGYALSEDGMWQQHSWLVLRTHRAYKIIETTEKRLAYYGFALTREQCEEWVEKYW